MTSFVKYMIGHTLCYELKITYRKNKTQIINYLTKTYIHKDFMMMLKSCTELSYIIKKFIPYVLIYINELSHFVFIFLFSPKLEALV